jgi:hypothetical protein
LAIDYVFRAIFNNFVVGTRILLEEQDLEVGYCFENLLFGFYERELWISCSSVLLDEPRWSGTIPILSRNEVQNSNKRWITNPRLRGILFDDEEGHDL